MRIKRVSHKNQMAKKKSMNASTNWVPSEFEQSDLTKAQENGFLVKRDQVIFPSTERIPKPPSGYWVMFLAFFCVAYPFLPTNFSVSFSSFTTCSFTSSCQILFCTSLVLLLFASLSWESNLIGFSENFSSTFALVSLYRRNLS
jgi:hypothetical protein